MGAVEAAVRARRGRARELVDRVDASEPGRDAQVARLEPEQVDDLAVSPEEGDDERRAAVTPRGEVGASAGGEQQLGEPAVVAVAGLVELRPAVVVAAVDVGAALEQQPDEVEVARDAEQVVVVRAALLHELPMLVEQRAQPLEVAVLDRAVGEHERRRRLLAARKRLHTARQLRPTREPVPLRELAAPRSDLLQAARDALPPNAARPLFPHQRLGLELRMASPSDPPSDTTNYLGGVADVLEAKARRGDLLHLGELAAVELYTNDRQIQRVDYRIQRSDSVSYTVRIWPLDQRA